MAITRTKIFPVEGQSPIVLHDVPQSVELVGDVTGDKGTNEVWDDTKRIEDFEVKITTLDEYSTGKPHKVIKRVDTLNTTSKTWTEGTQETYEASEKTFNLNYKGHERDFEVKVVEGEGGAFVPSPVYTFLYDEEEGTTMWLYEIEPLKEEWKDVWEGDYYAWSEVPIEQMEGSTIGSGEHLKNIGEVPSDCPIDDDKFYLASLEELPKEVLLDKNIKCCSDNAPIEDSHITFVASGSSPKLQIRYRWGMNDSHDLACEKSITITERPRPTPQEPSDPQEGGVHGLGMGIRSWVASKAVVPYWLKCPVSSIPDTSDVEGYNEITKEWELLEYLSNDEYGDNYILVDAMYSSLRYRSTQEPVETERISGYVEDIQSSYFYISAEDFSELIEAFNGCATQGTSFYFFNFMDEYWVIIEPSYEYNGYYDVQLVHNNYEGEKVYDSSLTVASNGSLEFTWDDTEGHIVNIIQDINRGIGHFFNLIWENLNDGESLNDYYDEELDSFVYYLPSSVIGVIFPNMDVDRAIFSSGESSIVVEREGDQYKVTNGDEGLKAPTVEVDGVKYIWDMGVVVGLAVPCDYIEFNLDDKQTKDSYVYFPLSEKPHPYHEGYTPVSQYGLYVAFSKTTSETMQCFIAPPSILSTMGIELSSEYWGALIFMGEPLEDASKAYFMFMSDDGRSGGYFGGENGELIVAG